MKLRSWLYRRKHSRAKKEFVLSKVFVISWTFLFLRVFGFHFECYDRSKAVHLFALPRVAVPHAHLWSLHCILMYLITPMRRLMLYVHISLVKWFLRIFVGDQGHQPRANLQRSLNCLIGEFLGGNFWTATALVNSCNLFILTWTSESFDLYVMVARSVISSHIVHDYVWIKRSFGILTPFQAMYQRILSTQSNRYYWVWQWFDRSIAFDAF